MTGVAADTSGDYWRGDDLDDVAEYLRAYKAGRYAPAQVVEFACPQCRGLAFEVLADAAEGCAQLTCQACGTMSFAADSGEHWEGSAPAPVLCPCGGKSFAAAIGFALRRDGDVRWISVGTRCLADGTLGAPADWKIDYSPSAHLIESPAVRRKA